ncbi:MAG TPA: NADH-quinone oxidoreductase subunit C [Saprospiraceae bacterium]|nr:NADH-quinone oxidoreductase subunit C [Saprospiraceae bacterium]
MLTKEQLEQQLQSQLGEPVPIEEDRYGVWNTEVSPRLLYRMIQFLFKDKSLSFQFLTDLCGVHYPDQKDRELGVVYFLHSMRNRVHLRVKVFVPEARPEVPSLTGIFASANWMERETYDFYGIRFLGHPDLRRILNMDEMIDFPMRREFPLEDPTREDKADFHFGR